MRNMPRSSVRAPPAAKPPKPPGPADWSALWRLTVCSMTGLHDLAGHHPAAHEREVNPIYRLAARYHDGVAGEREPPRARHDIDGRDRRHVVAAQRHVADAVVAFGVRLGLRQVLALSLAAEARRTQGDGHVGQALAVHRDVARDHAALARGSGRRRLRETDGRAKRERQNECD